MQCVHSVLRSHLLHWCLHLYQGFALLGHPSRWCVVLSQFGAKITILRFWGCGVIAFARWVACMLLHACVAMDVWIACVFCSHACFLRSTLFSVVVFVVVVFPIAVLCMATINKCGTSLLFWLGIAITAILQGC